MSDSMASKVKIDPTFPVVVVEFDKPTVKVVLDYDAAMKFAIALIEHAGQLKARK